MVNQLIFRCEDKKVLSTPSNNIPRIGESVWIDDGKWHRSEYKVIDVGNGIEAISTTDNTIQNVVLSKNVIAVSDYAFNTYCNYILR